MNIKSFGSFSQFINNSRSYLLQLGVILFESLLFKLIILIYISSIFSTIVSFKLSIIYVFIWSYTKYSINLKMLFIFKNK